MDFIRCEGHIEHDVSWTLHSSLHNKPVCLGCIVETIEKTELLPLQKKPALTEFLRILTQQSAQLLQLFMKEERIVWHIITILLESLKLEEDSYLALSVTVLLKMVQLIGSEDLVTEILDAVVKQVENTADHRTLQPHYTLVGKMLYQLPALAETLLLHYDWLLNELSLDLCKVGETVQSSIAYIFIYLCDNTQGVKLSARTLQQVHSGMLNMLSSARALPVLVNGLGLLKKLIEDSAGCQSLMTLNQEGVTLLTCMKKLLLSKKDVLQTSVCQILSLILTKENYQMYASTVLESDIVEFLFESLHTENTVQIECIMKVLQRLSNVEQFYKRCHSVYGVESILRALATSIELKNPTLLSHGYILLADILNRHPEDTPLFLSSSVVQKCLSLIQEGLGHHQNAVAHTAHDAFYAMLKKKYLLLPVPFPELTKMFSMVTNRKMEKLKSFQNLSVARQTKNIDTLISSLERYVDLTVKCCKLVSVCRDDQTSCESNFAAPGKKDGPSPMETFREMLFNAGQNICDVLTETSANILESAQLYVKVQELLCTLSELDSGKSYDLIYQLILTGFIINLIDVMVKYDSVQLNTLTDQFLKLTVECCQRRGILPAEGHILEILDMHHFKWPFACLPQVLMDGNVDIDMIEAYLVIIYISCKDSSCLNRQKGFSDTICSILNGHLSLEQFSTLGKKHYIYLLSYVNTYEGISIRQAVPNGLECLPSILQGTSGDWYTHDISMLIWVFGDPVLATTSAQNIVEAFFDNTSLELMRQVLDTEGCLENDTLSRLCADQTFLSALVRSMANTNSNNVSKISLLLEVHIINLANQTGTNTATENQTDKKQTEHEPESKQLDFLFHKITEVLQNVFLKNYSHAQDHSVVGLLELILLLIKYTQSAHSIGVKILYHVLNMLSKREEREDGIERACMLTVLSAVTSYRETQSQTSICAIVVQHEGFMSYLQCCLDNTEVDVMYCMACDLLVAIIGEKNLKCDNAVQMDITKVVNSVCKDSADRQVASVNLLSALFSVNLTNNVIKVTGRIYPAVYRTLYIQLQQSCLKEESETACSAVNCMRNLILYLYQSERDIGDELLGQPWNTMLLDIVLNLGSSSRVMEHQLCLLSMFTEFETSCNLIKTTSYLLDKVMKFVQLTRKTADKSLTGQFITLMKQLRTNFEDVFSENMKQSTESET